MPDTFSKDKRRGIMLRVRSDKTSLQRLAGPALDRRGLRFRLCYPTPGCPPTSGRVIARQI
jgi:G:T-mismatch repair DNA endonuclease (very short patch repair protein)